jgi:hypothetical protein
MGGFHGGHHGHTTVVVGGGPAFYSATGTYLICRFCIGFVVGIIILIALVVAMATTFRFRGSKYEYSPVLSGYEQALYTGHSSSSSVTITSSPTGAVSYLLSSYPSVVRNNTQLTWSKSEYISGQHWAMNSLYLVTGSEVTLVVTGNSSVSSYNTQLIVFSSESDYNSFSDGDSYNYFYRVSGNPAKASFTVTTSGEYFFVIDRTDYGSSALFDWQWAVTRTFFDASYALYSCTDPFCTFSVSFYNYILVEVPGNNGITSQYNVQVKFNGTAFNVIVFVPMLIGSFCTFVFICIMVVIIIRRRRIAMQAAAAGPLATTPLVTPTVSTTVVQQPVYTAMPTAPPATAPGYPYPPPSGGLYPPSGAPYPPPSGGPYPPSGAPYPPPSGAPAGYVQYSNAQTEVPQPYAAPAYPYPYPQ